MLSSHSLPSQIAGKPVRISCQKMCWYELTVQCSGASTGIGEWPSSWGFGCYVCASGHKDYYWQNQGSICFGVGKFLSKAWTSFPLPKKATKKIGKSIRNGVSLLKRMFSQLLHCSFFPVDSCRAWWFCSQIIQNLKDP